MHDWKALAAQQHGVISRAQLLDAGLSTSAVRRRREAGIFDPVLPGVFRVAGAPPSWQQSLHAARLWAGPAAVVSHEAAAAIWCMPGFDAGPVVVSGCAKCRPPSPIVVHRGVPDRRFVCTRDSLPVTNPSRTLMDLAAVIADTAAVERALDEMLRQGRTSLRQLRWGIEQLNGPGRRGVGALGRLLAARDPTGGPSVNEFQARVLNLLSKAGLRGAVDEYEIRSDDGGLLGRADIVFPEHRLAIECDGYASHSGRAAFEHDRVRGNRIVLAGYRVLHLTWARLTQDPEGFLAEVRDAVAGWPPSGRPRR